MLKDNADIIKDFDNWENEITRNQDIKRTYAFVDDDPDYDRELNI